ncbi:hypothetical protein IRP16_004029 [Salmonella enterica]|nr:hypothetical protein [Salmonella enterica]EGM2344849.1 hypothetical protein [Salmonella enterica]EGM2363675.1 hypothetical protein [Salmonella enterica]
MSEKYLPLEQTKENFGSPLLIIDPLQAIGVHRGDRATINFFHLLKIRVL